MSGRGRKRAAGNGTSSSQQQGQVRQGSSFWTCPACNTAVHAALMSFHLSSCPVVAADEVAPMKRRKSALPLRQQQTDEEKRVEEQGTGQSSPLGSPEFTLVRKRGFSQKKSVWEDNEEDELSTKRRGRPGSRNPCVWEDDLDEEDVIREEQQLKGRALASSHLSMEAGNSAEKLLSCLLPETPIQEVRDRIGVGEQMTESPASPAEKCLNSDPDPAAVRKRLFDDWGPKLRPDPPELVVQLPHCPHVAVATSPFSVDPQAKRPKVTEFDQDELRMVIDLGLIDSGSEGGNVADVETQPYLESIQDSQEGQQQQAVALDHTEKSPEELGKNLETNQTLQADNICSLETATEIEGVKRTGDVFSQRELQLENVLRELREEYCRALLRETELQRILELKNEECEILHRREQELQRELLCMRGQLETTLQGLGDVVNRGEQKGANKSDMPDQSPTQIHKEDELLATQILSQTSNTPASCTSSPRGAKDEFFLTRRNSVSSQNLMTAHNLVETFHEEQATQLLSNGLDPGCSPNMDEAVENSQASTEFRGLSGSGTGPSELQLGESFFSLNAELGKVDKFVSRRLFGGGKRIDNGNRKDEFSSLLPSSMYAAAVLAPHTPGKALSKPVGEHEEREGFGRDDSSNLYTMGNQRPEGTPGGGPKTPAYFAVILGGQEKGSISEMLGSFPPAQGIETHGGIDPFGDHFLETVTTSNVPNTSKDGQIFVSDGLDQKLRLDMERLNRCKPSAVPQVSENSQEETLGAFRPKNRKRNPALVIDSDSDVDIGDDLGESRKDTKDSTLPGTNVDKLDSGPSGQISNPAAYSHPDPVMEASSGYRSLDQSSSNPPLNVLFGMNREDNALGISVRGSGKKLDESSSGNSPDPIIEITRMDRQLFSPPSVNVFLSSDEEGDIREGSGGSGKKGKRRRLVKVQESPVDAKNLQPDPDSERARETGIEKLRRSLGRLRNVYTSPKQSTLLSEQEGDSEAYARRSKGLGTSDHGSSSRSHVRDTDEESLQIESDWSDGQQSGAHVRLRKHTATQKHKYSGSQKDIFSSKLDGDGDEEDDIETDDSFINDDPESDVDASSSSAVDEIAESSEERANDGSSSSRSSSDGRKKYNWELEGEMLAALAKNTELCLRGLCAIYRRQEEDEKMWASSKYRNKRGFNTFHSSRASSIASFLMGDSTNGPVVKTVEELKNKFDENAMTYCSDICIHYSKQLFEIYQDNEDPYFPESYTSPMV